jgi:hypothetical protein
VKRLPPALLLLILLLLIPAPVQAEDQPFRTVVDSILPKTPGLTIQGAVGGCTLLLQNQTGQDVVLFDASKPAKSFRFPSQPKTGTPRPPSSVVLTALTGVWPCASLPAVTEDQRWNHVESTVVSWSLKGAVGAVTFVISARSVYDPALDSAADLTLYVRIGLGALVLGGMVIAVPYLIGRRREILGGSKKAA